MDQNLATVYQVDGSWMGSPDRGNPSPSSRFDNCNLGLKFNVKLYSLFAQRIKRRTRRWGLSN